MDLYKVESPNGVYIFNISAWSQQADFFTINRYNNEVSGE